MKKILLPMLMLILAFIHLNAQGKTEVATMEMKDAPSIITKALEKDFPNFIASGFTKIPSEVVASSVSEDRNSLQKQADGYYVDLTGKNSKVHATYSADGKLLTAKEQFKNTKLPMNIIKAIERDYAGWKIGEDHEVVTINKKDQEKSFYRVELSNNKVKRWISYDAQGIEIKEGKEHKEHM